MKIVSTQIFHFDRNRLQNFSLFDKNSISLPQFRSAKTLTDHARIMERQLAGKNTICKVKHAPIPLHLPKMPLELSLQFNLG